MRDSLKRTRKKLFPVVVAAAGLLAPIALAQQATQPVQLDPSRLPDIGGIHLGMKLPEARAALQKLYPNARIDALNGLPTAVSFFRVQGDNTGHNQAGVDFTYPPNTQVVWHVARTSHPQVAHGTLVAALRQKYGKESFGLDGVGAAVANDAAITEMYWVFDERGQPVSGMRLANGSPYGCGGQFTNFATTGMPADFYLGVASNRGGTPTGYCASSYVAVHVALSDQDIVNDMSADIVDLPLMMRSSVVTDAWMKAGAQKARQQDIDKSKQEKAPTF